MLMFTHVKNRISGIYKDLTRTEKWPNGGSASLSFNNDNDEPYLDGISYMPHPPGKRYRDFSECSGGEKAIGALALLFAVHSFCPAPFFVMDEIDANLDQGNRKRLVRYIRQRVDEDENSFQAIIISLHPSFYGQADGLLGVMRDPDTTMSTTRTFSLEKFRRK